MHGKGMENALFIFYIPFTALTWCLFPLMSSSCLVVLTQVCSLRRVFIPKLHSLVNKSCTAVWLIYCIFFTTTCKQVKHRRDWKASLSSHNIPEVFNAFTFYKGDVYCICQGIHVFNFLGEKYLCSDEQFCLFFIRCLISWLVGLTLGLYLPLWEW